MNPKYLSSLLVCAFFLPAVPGNAALVAEAKIKRWAEEEKQLVRALDVWMTDEEMSVFLKLKTPAERRGFLQETGHLKRWTELEEAKDQTIFDALKKGQVIEGMSKDEVFMTWDTPTKIRDEFKREAYVKVLWYEFEIDRKGREFLVRPDSETAYKNDLVMRHVYLYNDSVHAIVDADSDQGSDMVDQIIAAEKEKQKAREAAIEAQTQAGAAAEAAEPARAEGATPAPQKPAKVEKAEEPEKPVEEGDLLDDDEPEVPAETEETEELPDSE